MSKITAYASLASTQPDDVLPVVDVHDTSMAATGTTKKVSVAGLLAALGAVITPAPSGDATGATDTAALQAAINACPAGGTLLWQPGIYVTNAPLVYSKRVINQGSDAGFGWGIYAGSYSPSGGQFEPGAQTGTVIQAAPGWAKGSAAGAGIILLIADSSHYITEGPVFSNICISGTAGTGSGGIAMTATADAILAIGPVVNVLIDNVTCMYVRGWGVNTAFDPSTPGGSSVNTPGTWRVRRLCVFACTAGGINEQYVSDSIWDDVLVIGCYGPGWKLTGGNNSIFKCCRAEWNGSHGFWLTGAWETGTGSSSMITFSGCTTDANTGNGMLVDTTAGNYTILISGIVLHRDGNVSGGGTAAGLAISQAAAAGLTFRVLARGVVITSATAGFATANPANGVSLNGTGVWLDIDGAYLIGRTAAVSITGTPARAAWGPAVTYWTGSSDAPVSAAAQGTAVPGDLTVSGIAWLSAVNAFGPLNMETNQITGITYLGIKEGANTRQGTVTLNGTTNVVVATTAVTASSRIHLTIQSKGGVTPGVVYVSARTAGTSFSVVSTVASDNSVVAWTIFEPG